MTDTINAVRSCCAHVERAEREVVQTRLRPDGLVFDAGSLSHSPRSVVAFSERTPSGFRSVPGVYRGCCLRSSDVLGVRC